ncbi:hypothetical protein CRG98_020623 [Punica granatum]|uniref:Uncharacterized protein n=1 Tax=Punica granatum TaxID=22663 RepID=A0A2I0JRP8_PUNGR|nr:hypothetical protein CRG98_020623 [Punica granatum]
MATTNQSELVIDEARAKSKKQRESLRDPLSSLEGRMTKMEFVMANVQGKTEDASKGMEELCSDLEELRSDLEELQEGMQSALNTVVDELTKRDETLEALVSAMRAEIDELKAELVQVRRTRVDGGGMGQLSARPDVPKPKEFRGTRVAKDMDNFIWSMETYFRATGVKDDAVRVGMVSMYLVDVALLCTTLSMRRMKLAPSFGSWSIRVNFGRSAQGYVDGGVAGGIPLVKAGSSKPKGKDERMLKCFLCDGLHMARECPTKAKLVALVKADKEKEEETRLGSLGIFSSITTRKANRSKGLMFADVEIVGKAFSALVDIGASNLFIFEEGAKKLGLRVKRTRGRLKMVNSEEVPTCGVAKDVDIRIGQWSGKETIEQSMGNGQKTLSAMQLKRRIQKGEVTYLATLKVDEGASSGDDVLAEVAQVLDSFEDVMLAEHPKKLPPKREADHRIELVPDAKPHATASYWMALPELAELRKQLKEVLDAGYV